MSLNNLLSSAKGIQQPQGQKSVETKSASNNLSGLLASSQKKVVSEAPAPQTNPAPEQTGSTFKNIVSGIKNYFTKTDGTFNASPYQITPAQPVKIEPYKAPDFTMKPEDIQNGVKKGTMQQVSSIHGDGYQDELGNIYDKSGTQIYKTPMSKTLGDVGRNVGAFVGLTASSILTDTVKGAVDVINMGVKGSFTPNEKDPNGFLSKISKNIEDFSNKLNEDTKRNIMVGKDETKAGISDTSHLIGGIFSFALPETLFGKVGEVASGVNKLSKTYDALIAAKDFQKASEVANEIQKTTNLVGKIKGGATALYGGLLSGYNDANNVYNETINNIKNWKQENGLAPNITEEEKQIALKKANEAGTKSTLLNSLVFGFTHSLTEKISNGVMNKLNIPQSSFADSIKSGLSGANTFALQTMVGNYVNNRPIFENVADQATMGGIITAILSSFTGGSIYKKGNEVSQSQKDILQRQSDLNILGVNENSTPNEIRSSYLDLAKQNHPDLGGNPETMAKINDAYARLHPSIKDINTLSEELTNMAGNNEQAKTIIKQETQKAKEFVLAKDQIKGELTKDPNSSQSIYSELVNSGIPEVNAQQIIDSAKNEIITDLQSEKSNNDTITLYHASPDFPKSGNWKEGTYFATTEDAARYYAESHHEGDMTIKKVTLPKDILFKEPSTGNYTLKTEYPISESLKISKPKVKSDPLVEEARKYKSAEDFINSISVLKEDYDWNYFDEMQADKDAGRGYAHSDYAVLSALAQKYRGKEPAQTLYRAGSIKTNIYGEKLKDVYLTPNKGLAEQYANSGDTKVKEYVVLTKNNLDATPEMLDKIFGDKEWSGLANDPKLKEELIQYAKDNGYDSVKFADSGTDGYGIAGHSLVVFDSNNIKTRSQLTKIWNQAHSQKSDIIDNYGETKNKLPENSKSGSNSSKGKIRFTEELTESQKLDVEDELRHVDENIGDLYADIKYSVSDHLKTEEEYNKLVEISQIYDKIEKINQDTFGLKSITEYADQLTGGNGKLLLKYKFYAARHGEGSFSAALSKAQHRYNKYGIKKPLPNILKNYDTTELASYLENTGYKDMNVEDAIDELIDKVTNKGSLITSANRELKKLNSRSKQLLKELNISEDAVWDYIDSDYQIGKTIDTTSEAKAPAKIDTSTNDPEIRKSRAFQRLKESLDSEYQNKDEPVYQVKHRDEELAKAIELYNKDHKYAEEVALGRATPPDDISETMISRVVADMAGEKGDYKLQAEALSARSLRQTLRGQELAMEGTKDENSAEYFIKRVLQKRRELIDKGYSPEIKKGGNFESQIKRKKAKMSDSFRDSVKIKAKYLDDFFDEITCPY